MSDEERAALDRWREAERALDRTPLDSPEETEAAIVEEQRRAEYEAVSGDGGEPPGSRRRRTLDLIGAARTVMQRARDARRKR